MKSLFLVLVLVIVSGSTLASPRKEGRGQEIIGPIEDYECPHNGVFADEDACDQFIECWTGEANLWRCTDQMLFDLTYDGCNYAQYVHCQDRPRPTNVPSTTETQPSTTTSNVSTTTTPAPPIDFECPEDGVFAHEERCEYYWKCWAGIPELIHCELDYLYDRRYDGCNFPDLTDCDHRLRPGTNTTGPPPTTTTTRRTTTTTERPITDSTEPTEPTTHNPNATTTTTTTKEPGEEFECPDGQDGDFADPQDCSAFYTCVGGFAYHQYCPAGLHFNPLLDVCDFPANVDCGDRPIPSRRRL